MSWYVVREDTDEAHGWTYDHQPAVDGPYASFDEARDVQVNLDGAYGDEHIAVHREPG